MKTITEKSVWGGFNEYQVNDKGQKHGSYKYWFKNKQIGLECTFVNERCHGICKDVNSNGKINFIDQTKKGDTHGIDIEFDDWS